MLLVIYRLPDYSYISKSRIYASSYVIYTPTFTKPNNNDKLPITV